MALSVCISGRIGCKVEEVFDAVVNPTKLSSYFTTVGGASAPLVAGTTVIWWKKAPVEVQQVEPNRRIVLGWEGGTGEDGGHYQTRIEMTFDALDDGGTLVKIEESGWRDDEAGRRGSYMNCEGWTQMLCCMKAFVEYDINLREGFFLSEMRGEPAEAPDR